MILGPIEHLQFIVPTFLVLCEMSFDDFIRKKTLTYHQMISVTIYVSCINKKTYFVYLSYLNSFEVQITVSEITNFLSDNHIFTSTHMYGNYNVVCRIFEILKSTVLITLL